MPKYTDYSYPTELFYEYFDKSSPEYRKYRYFNHNPITWSSNLNNVYNITGSNNLFDDDQTIIDTNEAFYEEILENPYQKIPGYIYKDEWAQYVSKYNVVTTLFS